MEQERERPAGRRRRRVARGLIVALAALVLLEGGLRIGARVAQRERGLSFHADFGWRPLPGITKVGRHWSAKVPAWTNSRGWRDAEAALERATGVRRIVVLGDSFTFGVQVDYGERFTEVLEETTPRLEVVNLGVNAFGTDQELRVLEVEGALYRPDVVVLLAYLGNDLDDIRYERRASWPKPWYELEADGALRLIEPSATWDVRLRSSTYIGELLLRASNRARSIMTERWRDADTVPLFVRLVAEMRRVSAGVNARFLAVLAYPDERLSSGRSPREERVLEGLTGAGIAVCDLFDTFLRERDAGAALFVDEGHWSAAGHRLAAAEIARELSERGWLPD